MQKFCKFAHLKTTFSILQLIFTKHSHQFIYFIHLFNKIFIFSHHHLSRRPNTTHTATIIQPPNHHHQATIPFYQATINEIHIPIQLSHHHHHHQATIINLPKSKDPKTDLSERVRDGSKGQREWGTAMTWATTSDGLSNNEINTSDLSNKIEPINQATTSTP